MKQRLTAFTLATAMLLLPGAAFAGKKKNATMEIPPTQAEIQQSAAQGLVWASTSNMIYHRPGSKKYGLGRHGKFMAEAEAKAAGYTTKSMQKGKQTP